MTGEMSGRRRFARFWRRLRRPSLGRLVAGSALLHAALFVLAVWVGDDLWTPAPRQPATPLIVELPPAAPGTPAVRPEVPAPAPSRPSARAAPRVATRPPPARSVREPALADRPAAAPPAVAPAPPEPPTPPAPPPPVETAAAPPAPPPVSAPIAPPPALAAPDPAPPPVLPPPVSPPPQQTARLPEPSPSPAPPGPRATPDGGWTGGPSGPGDPPWANRRFSVLRPEIEIPPPRTPLPPGSGGRGGQGDGAGETGRQREGQASVPLDTPDPRYADYFLEIKRRIEAHLVYPQEAARREQSGQLMLEFVLRKDGSVRLVELVRSSGVGVLDRYSLNTVKLAAPFPPIPERMGLDTLAISASFTYVLDRGFRVFGLH